MLKTVLKHFFVIDNLLLGRIENLEKLDRVKFLNIDLSNFEETKNAINEIQSNYSIKEIWHMAANSDIPAGILNPDVDFKNTFLSTYNLINSLILCIYIMLYTKRE